MNVRDCIRNILSSYQSQGATGVRFLLGLGGGGHSTPFAPDGGVYTCWLSMLSDFLADVASYGYTTGEHPILCRRKVNAGANPTFAISRGHRT